MITVVVMLLVAVLLLAAAWIGPKRVWWSTRSWMYANPRSVEPSDEAFALRRAVCIVVGLGLIFFAINRANDLGAFRSGDESEPRLGPLVEEAVWGATRNAYGAATVESECDSRETGMYLRQVSSAISRASSLDQPLVVTLTVGRYACEYSTSPSQAEMVPAAAR